MKPRRLLVTLLVLSACASGCRLPWEPKSGPIVGTVVYASGAPARAAQVEFAGMVSKAKAITAFDGSFVLAVPEGADTVIVVAEEGRFSGTYAVVRYGSVRVSAAGGATRVRIVMDHSSPI